MLNTIAKRYTKAILKSWTMQQLGELLETLNKVKIANEMNKFRELMQTPYLNFSKKQDMVLQIADTADHKTQNLISILLKNNRLDCVAYICDLLEEYISFQNKTYNATVFSREVLDKQIVENIQEKLANHLGVRLELKQEQIDKDGISLSIDGLGMEISFSKDRFFDSLKSHILKAI